MRSGPKPIPIEDRFWPKVVDAGGCWIWTGAVRSTGYGHITVGSMTDRSRRGVLAHRLAYELVVGVIPDGLTIDHLCRNRLCVNPAHLEAVTMRENNLRGEGQPARNARKTRCPRGHEYDRLVALSSGSRSRKCRRCEAENQRRRRRAQKASAR